MAQFYELANGFSLTDKDNNLFVCTPKGEYFIINTKGIFRQTEECNQLLNMPQNKEICQDLLRAIFDLPSNINIQRADFEQMKDGHLLLKIEANDAENKVQIELKIRDNTAELNHVSSELQIIDHGISKAQSQISYFTSATERSYLQSEKQKDNVCSEIFENHDRLFLRRSIKKDGSKLVLVRKKSTLTDDGYASQSEEHTSFEISANAITGNIEVTTDKYKKKLKIRYQAKDKTLQIQIKRTDFDAIPITEFKATVLTHKTGKKVTVTTLYDKELEATFIRYADGSFEYKQAQTNAEAYMEKSKTTEDFTKVNVDIVKEEKSLQEILKRMAIICNSQNTETSINFLQNPSIFDDKIGFTAIKDVASVKLTEALLHTKSDMHQRLLATVVRIANGNFLALPNEKQYS